MHENIHFISGLPRSGSTLLAALLRQNPRVHATMSSPVCGLFHALQREMSQGFEYSYFLDDEKRSRILRGCFDGYYGGLPPGQIIFDTNRNWAGKIDAVTRLYPKSKMVCCVRNVAWIIDSIESLLRRNALEPSKIFNFDPTGSVYTRAEGLMASNGLIGGSLFSLREAAYGDHASRLMLVRFETLTSDPVGTLNKIYDFIEEPRFEHRPDQIEPIPGAAEFDARLGTPGLHRLASTVFQHQRRSILPDDLFNRYQVFSFWQNTKEMPSWLRMI